MCRTNDGFERKVGYVSRTKVRGHIGSTVRKYFRKYESTFVRKYESTFVRKYSTYFRKYEGTKVRKYLSIYTEVGRFPLTTIAYSTVRFFGNQTFAPGLRSPPALHCKYRECLHLFECRVFSCVYNSSRARSHTAAARVLPREGATPRSTRVDEPTRERRAPSPGTPACHAGGRR